MKLWALFIYLSIDEKMVTCTLKHDLEPVKPYFRPYIYINSLYVLYDSYGWWINCSQFTKSTSTQLKILFSMR